MFVISLFHTAADMLLFHLELLQLPTSFRPAYEGIFPPKYFQQKTNGPYLENNMLSYVWVSASILANVHFLSLLCFPS